MIVDGAQGTVESFDADSGLGAVVSTDGQRFDFHCTAIVDGSRQIADGQTVSFTVGPVGPGRWEARRVTPIPGDVTPTR